VGCYGTSIGNTGTAIGKDKQIHSYVNGCSEAGIATRICDNLVLTDIVIGFCHQTTNFGK